MRERLITPSKVTAWLDCAHYLTLRHQVEDGHREEPQVGMGSFAELLREKGLEHEDACRRAYEADGTTVVEVVGKRSGERFLDWVARVEGLLAEGHEVLFQMPFVHDGVRGVADFLERVDLPDGSFTYEPVDAKLARSSAKPGHVLQLCFYAEAIEGKLGAAPESAYVWLGSGSCERIRLAEVTPYWRRLKRRLLDELRRSASGSATSPVPCRHCDFCEFAAVCEREWREEDALHFVAGLRRQHQDALEGEGVNRAADLATRTTSVPGLDDARLGRLRQQAALQIEARAEPDEPPPYRQATPDGPSELWGRGHELLPAPDEGDVFLDFEGHPFWRADCGLFFLFGFVAQDDDGQWTYTGRWAHDKDEEGAAAEWLVDQLWERREQHPSMHVYHYNHTERSGLQSLFLEHDLDDTRLAVMIREGTFVDLLEVVRNAIQVGTESYGLKRIEPLAGFERSREIDAGAGAVVVYDDFTQRVAADDRPGLTHEDETALADIADYNEDDVNATRALRDWLLDIRPDGTPWRPAVVHEEPDFEEVHATVTALRDLGGEFDVLLADLLSYWRREDRAHAARLRAFAESDPDDLRDEPGALVGLHDHQLVDIPTPTGRKAKRPSLVARFPDQEVESFNSAMWLTPEGPPAYAGASIDTGQGQVVLKVSQDSIDHGEQPTTVVANDWIGSSPKPETLLEWARAAVGAGGVTSLDDVGSQLLTRRPTRFLAGGGVGNGPFPDDLDEQAELVGQLDRSYLAVQGPPGTGKTYRAARMIRALVLAGRRVGITALSHAAIHNLVEEVHDVFAKEGDAAELSAIVKRGSQPEQPLDGVRYESRNPPCGDPAYNLVAGTTWLFANDVMRDTPVDVLFVDEAGQLGLADVLAAATSAHSLVLTGDPQQLPQVAQATHPGDAGSSVLQYILQGRKTLPDDEGFFLDETWRLHPDICSFISEQFYESRLATHPSCSVQGTELGTGLRWLEAHHEDCATRSDEEVALVADHVGDLLGRSWTDRKGVRRQITPADVMVVTPYNRQKDALRRGLERDEALRDVRVGTVDKFQGQEAAVVVFSAAASSAQDAARGIGFVFDRHRFNVAISRARCLAVLVCTRELLDASVTSIEAMRTVAAACDFVERAQPRS